MSTNVGQTSQSQGTIIIQLVLSKIADNDIQAVNENLSRLPLGAIPKGQAETLLSWFLGQATKYSNIQAIRTIIAIFDINRLRVDPVCAITNIFLNPSLSREIITFTISCFPEKAPVDYFVDLVNMGDDISALKAAGIISTYFPKLSNSDWNLLVSLTDNFEEEDYDNQLLRAYFQTKAAETGACTITPKWIRDDLDESTLETVPANIPSVKEAVDLIMKDFTKQGIQINSGANGDQHDIQHEIDAKETLISQYAISSVIEKIQMLSQVKEITMFNDIPLFQEFGPVNTIYTLNPSLIENDHVCSKYGGCRMFLCTEFEQMTIDGNEIDVMACDDQCYTQDWFRGSCDICLKKISKRFHSLRLPLKHGGWSGCYCSFECMEPLVSDSCTALMVGRIKEQLDVIGIRNR
jgi:hypothetical protein